MCDRVALSLFLLLVPLSVFKLAGDEEDVESEWRTIVANIGWGEGTPSGFMTAA
jgi:hypothetical protein